MAERPLILLSNDDGVRARGLTALQAAMAAVGDTITVAPTEQQSAGSHALTLHRPLRHRTLGDTVHAIDGSPADCIYVALYRERFLPRWPDLVVSGINHGYNLGTDVYYSGTVAAAREGALRGIPSLACSLGPKGDFERAASLVATLAGRLLEAEATTPGPHGALINVNVPGGDVEPRGVQATRLGRRVYVDEVHVREDPRGNEYYWIGGPSVHHEPLEGADTEAVDAGYVSVTPLRLDATDADELGLAAFVAAAPHDEEDKA
ncbi:MAG: 5'/3'-nucleotidase SurE [Sandaracinaceae bacterium]